MRNPCFVLRRPFRSGKDSLFKIFIGSVLIFIGYRTLLTFQTNDIRSDQSLKVEKFSVQTLNNTSTKGEVKTPKIQGAKKEKVQRVAPPKVVPKIRPITKEKPVKKPIVKKDNSIVYSLSAFKKYLNASIPQPYNHSEVSYLMSPKHVCDDKMDILIIVHSALANQERRDAIRFSMGRYAAKLKYKIIFVVGTPAKGSIITTLRENSEFKDLLMIDVVDSYKNMTYKAIGWIKWLVDVCEKKPDFILKMDDDTLIKIPELIDMLLPCKKKSSDLICKHMSCMVRPKEPTLRDGKNKVTIEEYPLKHYPRMCPGFMYVFPASLINSLLEATEKVPFMWLDDVYVTVFLRMHIGGHLLSLKQHYMEPADRKYKKLYKNKMVGHLKSKHFARDYLKIWDEMIQSYNKKKS